MRTCTRNRLSVYVNLMWDSSVTSLIWSLSSCRIVVGLNVIGCGGVRINVWDYHLSLISDHYHHVELSWFEWARLRGCVRINVRVSDIINLWSTSLTVVTLLVCSVEGVCQTSISLCQPHSQSFIECIYQCACTCLFVCLQVYVCESICVCI